MLRCFKSTHKLAWNASLVYEANNDGENLWRRSPLQTSLPSCSSTSPPSNNSCLVCAGDAVFAVCNNVGKTAKVIMEAGGDTVPIAESVCPDLRSKGLDAGSIAGIVFAAFIVIILFIAFIKIFVCKKKQTRSDSRAEAQTEEAMLGDDSPKPPTNTQTVIQGEAEVTPDTSV